MFSIASQSHLQLSNFRKSANVWFSVNNGNWSNPSTWISSNKGILGNFIPQSNDTVYISHNITVDMNVTVNNVYLNNPNNTLNFSATGSYTFNVNGDIQCLGTLDLSAQACTFNLYGFNNYIATFTAGTLSTFGYLSPFDQLILPLTYYHLTFNNNQGIISTNTLIGNTIVNGNLTSSYTLFQLSSYNFTINGTTTFQNGGGILKNQSSTGSTLFVGIVNLNYGSSWNFSGNGNLEFRNGWNWGNDDLYGYFYSGTGTYSFTTNNQTISRTYAYSSQTTFNCNVSIVGISLQLGDISNLVSIVFGGTVNGTNSSSYLVLLASQTAAFQNATSPMVTGNLTANLLSNIAYIGGAQDIKGGNYGNLTLDGTGAKRLLGNVSVKNTYILLPTPTLNTNGFALTNP